MRTILLLGGIAVLGSGCVATWDRECVYHGQTVYVYKESRTEDEATVAQNFDHPAEVSAAELASLLSRLQYDHKVVFRVPDPRQVFEKEHVQELAKPLSVALSAVGTDERVRFLVIHKSLGEILIGLTGT
ncbi:MAG: hypothetical protein AAF517_25380, partial [Planctomycetota bacterium]